MSLVERAVGEVLEKRLHRKNGSSNTSAAAKGQLQAGSYPYRKIFELNYRRLAEQGFFTPECKQHRLSLELRAIKRRLLRRMRFYRNERKEMRSGRTDSLKNTVLVTSTCPGEGKTFTSLNLALSLALEDNIDVLLIDADVPRPRVFHHLGMRPTEGLTDKIVQPNIPLSDLVLKEKNSTFTLLSEGHQRGAGLELVSRPEMGTLLKKISREFPRHIIIVDAPPVLATSEASLIARYVDEVLFVVKASDTKEPAVVTALDEVLDNNKNVSLILNNSLVAERASQYGSYGEYYERTPDNYG